MEFDLVELVRWFNGQGDGKGGIGLLACICPGWLLYVAMLAINHKRMQKEYPKL